MDTTPPRPAGPSQHHIGTTTGTPGESTSHERVFLLGGARSGKSSLAVDLAMSAGGPVTFVATAEPLDDEMASRIVAHRSQRPSDWSTIEAPLDIGKALAEVPRGDIVILDCLTLWVANLLGTGRTVEEIHRLAHDVSAVVAGRCAPVITVSNEVGSGIVPATSLGREYRDVLGDVNRIWANGSDRVYLLVAGRALELSRLEARGGLTR